MRITLPKSWANIPISKFPELNDILKDSEMHPTDKEIRIISCLSGVNVDTIERIEIGDLKMLIKSTSFVFNNEFPKAVNEFDHGGFRWKLNYDVKKLTAAQFISLSKYNETEDSTMLHLADITALFAKPYRKKWFRLIEVPMAEYERADLLASAPVSVIYPMTVFFCKVINNLLPTIKIYLENQEQKILKMISKEIEQNMKSM